MLNKIRSLRASSHNVSHQEGEPFLKVSDLHVHYDGLPALHDVNFELQGGEQVAVVGPNGAGKSTLFKALAGVLSPSRGVVRLGGHDPEGHICIAYLPQRSDVDWAFPVTVKDVVMMGRTGKLGFFHHPKSKDWEFVEECLSFVNLASLADRRINELSGGQQQRMFIAQSLAQEAELLLMDEPLAGLDLPSQDEVFTILEDLKRRDVTVMLSTHNLNIAAERFDAVMLLKGNMLGLGRPEEVFTNGNLEAAYGGRYEYISPHHHETA